MRRPAPILLTAALALFACGGGSKTDSKDTAAKNDAKAKDSKGGAAKVAEAKPAEAKAAPPVAAPSDAKVEEAKVEEAKAEPAEEGKAEEPADMKAVAAAKPRSPAPADTKQAVQQLSEWLDDADKAPVPALLDAAGEIEIALHCGPCTDDPAPDVSKVTGIDLAVERLSPPSGEEEVATWDVGTLKECKDDCCTFPKYEDEGSGNTSIDKVCMTLGADGKPTAYTRIDAVSH